MERHTFENILQAFDKADHDTITEAFTENTTWEIIGHWTLKGKDEIRKFFAGCDTEAVESSRERVLFTDSYAIVESKGKCRDATGKEWQNWCCDIYDFEGDKVRALRSFPVDKE